MNLEPRIIELERQSAVLLNLVEHLNDNVTALMELIVALRQEQIQQQPRRLDHHLQAESKKHHEQRLQRPG